jgi:hypothetical protein
MVDALVDELKRQRCADPAQSTGRISPPPPPRSVPRAPDNAPLITLLPCLAAGVAFLTLAGAASKLERRREALSFASRRPMTPRWAEASHACGLARPVPCVCVFRSPLPAGLWLRPVLCALSRDRPRPRPPGLLRMLARTAVSSAVISTFQ